MSRRTDNGRHRRRRTRITVPSVVGSVTVAAAASGALVMTPAAGSPGALEPDAGELDDISLDRPQASSPEQRSALDTVAAAGESLSKTTTRSARTAHHEIVEEREEAAEREAARKAREAKKWILPLDSYRISAGFGASSSLWSNYHTGLDFAADYGSDVRAISSGEIIFAGYDGAYGNKIAVQHWDGTVTWYAHLSRFIQTTGTVSPGTVIGEVGSTGNSTGPHLHLEVRPYNGDPVNPATWLAEHGVSV